MKEIVLASSNPNKLREINEIASSFGVQFESAPDGFNPEENGKTFEENAFIKAYEAAKLTNKIALADDTGLCVDALDGAPGIYSARFAKTQEEKISKMLSLLKDVPEEKRTAFFICSMVIVNPKGETLFSSVGKINGKIDTKPAGVNGFGYDPIFFIPEMNKTMAEMTEKEKNTVSHRALALNKVLDYIIHHA